MDLQARKYQLIQALINTTNENLVAKMENLLRKQDVDFWHELSAERQNIINEGIEQLDNGLGIPHQTVVSELKNNLNS